MQEFWHKMITGLSHKTYARLVAIFVLVWFVMDTIEFTDWVIDKFKTDPVCVPTTTFIPLPSPPPSWNFAPAIDPPRNREI
jgi:hypothetical protein